MPSPALATRLAALCGDERNLQVEFLLHLVEFDARRAWAEAGYGSLWAYCLEVLHLREGATYRRIEAMKLLRRFPSIEGPLREGKLCLTTAILLAPVLSDENLEELVARAAFLSKADTERLVVSIRPCVPPKDGIRRIPAHAGAAAPAAATLAPDAAPVDPAAVTPAPPASAFALSSPADTAPARPSARSEIRPTSADTYSLRVTIDAACKAELDQLVELLSHKTGGELAEVLREAIRCGIAQHGKRKGAVAPERKRATSARSEPARADPRFIPVEVRRAVWKRDGGCCAFVSPEGKRCGSRFRLEFGHVQPVALGGKPTIDNIRLECRPHNQSEAVRVFGREHMAPYLGRSTTSRESHGQ
jgi:5-methylcytosine-specific restriction endonuclease McrA